MLYLLWSGKAYVLPDLTILKKEVIDYAGRLLGM